MLKSKKVGAPMYIIWALLFGTRQAFVWLARIVKRRKSEHLSQVMLANTNSGSVTKVYHPAQTLVVLQRSVRLS